MEKEIPLLRVQESKREREWSWNWRRVGEEVKRVNSIGLPMMVVMMSQYLVRAAPTFMLGHLGEQLSLSSASIATSLCNATGFTVLFGMASALEILCGQANGAGQHGRLETFAAASIASLLLLCFPISLIWINAAKLLALTGQDPSISAAAGLYSVQLIPALFASAVLESLVRFLQSQSLILPILWSSAASLCINLPLCWAFIFKLDMGSGGAALAVTLASWFNACCLLLYVVYSPACRRTSLIPNSKGDMLAAMKDLFRIGLPSAFMFCYMIGGLHSYIPYSFGAAASSMIRAYCPYRA